MITLTVAEIAKAIDAQIVDLDPHETISEYPVIDSRDATAGTFFVALKGENVDGSDFAADAIARGARFAITSKTFGGPAFIVEDSLRALTSLAKFARDRARSCTFIAITGSQGKTTTKEFLGQILLTSGETVVPSGSFNNEIGLPLTLLRCTDQTKYCVLEMGARHSGDIAALCEIARPTIGAVLVVGSAHVGEFGSRSAIASTKAELIDSLPSDGVAVLGTYDEFTPAMASARSDLSQITFGEKSSVDVRAADIEIREGRAHFDLVTPAGRAAVSLRTLGAHQIANALAASAIATSLNIPIDSIASALSMVELQSKWRMELHDLGDYVVINDSYNANPESMAAALRTLALFAQERGGSSWAFLGKMHELGESEKDSHGEVGRLAAALGIDHLVAVGTRLYEISEAERKSLSMHYCPTQEDALALASHLAAGDCVLIKASRAEKLELLSGNIVTMFEKRSSGDSQ